VNREKRHDERVKTEGEALCCEEDRGRVSADGGLPRN
jgi:hypothetical protein